MGFKSPRLHKRKRARTKIAVQPSVQPTGSAEEIRLRAIELSIHDARLDDTEMAELFAADRGFGARQSC